MRPTPMARSHLPLLLALIPAAVGCATSGAAQVARAVYPWSTPPEARSAPSAAGQVKYDARAAEPLVTTAFAKRFLRAAEALPEVEGRPLLRTRDKQKYYSAAEAAAL